MNIKEYFNQIIDADLSMINLFLIKKMYVNLDRNYRKAMSKKYYDKDLATKEYQNTIEYFNKEVWNKLKSSLDYDDETINRIFSFVRTLDNIEEMYIQDDLVVTKTSDDKLFSSPEFKFKEITDESFISGMAKHKLTKLIIMSINNAIVPFVDTRVTTDDVLYVDSNVGYLNRKMKVYLTHNLSEILSDTTGTKVTKILVTYEDQAFGFDLKIRDDVVILKQHDVSLLSKKFEQKQKTR